MKRKFKMPKMLRFRRKKLRATAVRRPLRIGATTADYGDLAEPSMKLSRALLIVLLLHVVAVACSLFVGKSGRIFRFIRGELEQAPEMGRRDRHNF